MSVLTIRLREEEKSRVVREAREAGVSTGAYVREKLNRRPIDTAADLLRELDGMMGDQRLKVKRRR
jgi:hypothetical protein